MSILLLILSLLFVALFHKSIWAYYMFKKAKTDVAFNRCIFMRFRNTLKNELINAAIIAHQNNLKINMDELEALLLANADVEQVVDGLLYANKHKVPLNVKTASDVLLAKKDLREAIDKAKDIVKLEVSDNHVPNSAGNHYSYVYTCQFNPSVMSTALTTHSNQVFAHDIQKEIGYIVGKTPIEDTKNIETKICNELADKYWSPKDITPIDCKLHITNR